MKMWKKKENKLVFNERAEFPGARAVIDIPERHSRWLYDTESKYLLLKSHQKTVA